MMKLREVVGAVVLLIISNGLAQAEDEVVESPVCGGILEDLSGTIQSDVDDRGYYYVDSDCKWDIRRKEGYRIYVDVVRFNLTPRDRKTGQCFDYVSFNLDRKCGTIGAGYTFEPYSNGLEIQFVTDGEYEESGFELKFRQEKIPVCEPECENEGTCVRDNYCTCKSGHAGYRCTYEVPLPSAIIDTEYDRTIIPSKDCSIFGQRSVRMFDNSFVLFVGSCEYTLAEFGYTKITVTMNIDGVNTTNGIKSLKITKGEVHTVTISLDSNNRMIATDESRERIFDLPKFYGPFEITTMYDRIVVRDDDFKLLVDENGASASLTLDDKYSTQTRGLCGNFNGVIDDDLVTPSGNSVYDAEFFVKSWSQDQSCTASTADIPFHTNGVDYMICQQMRTAAFEPCASNSDIWHEKYRFSCENDLRICDYTSTPDCECASFTQYARDCVKLGGAEKLNWRQSRCQIQCPSNQIFSECATICERTCKSFGTGYEETCPEGCIDGCTCNEGLFWNGELCVEAANCTCYVGEVIYQSGEKVVEQCRDCVCESGELKCDAKACDGTAIAFGNPHYLTFDGLWYTYDGVCEYVLLEKSNELRILVDSENCGTESAFTCIEAITVSSSSFPKVHLLNSGEVEVANDAVLLPYTIGNTLEIRKLTSAYVSVHVVQLGIILLWNPDGILIVNVPELQRGKIGGLFGNYNGETSDEYTSPSGIVERTVAEFGKSWSTNTECAEIQTTGAETCVSQEKDAELCQNAVYHHEAFKDCLASTYHEERIRKFCKEALCAAQSEEEKQKNLCDTLSVFATLCAAKGHISEWRNQTFCNMECFNGKEYEPWTSSCGRTCRGVTEEEICTDSPKQEGCVCRKGMFEDRDGICIAKSECGCYYANKWHKNNDFFIHDSRDCQCKGGVVNCTGEKVANCTGDMVYTRCTGGQKGANCQPTCSNKELSCGQECEKGCACPNGTYYDAGKCVTEDQCECSFAGKLYQTGESVIDDCDHCLCNQGKWNCTRTTLCSRTCSVVSGSYFKTFDSAYFHHRGKCEYKLMTDACGGDLLNFVDINVKSHSCEGSDYTMCNLTIEARFGNEIFTLSRERAHEHSWTKSFRAEYADVMVRFRRLGFYQVIEADFPKFYIQLSFDNKTSVNIEVSKNITSPEFGRKLCGLCGNLDESASNDFTTKNGETDSAGFVNSWKIDASCFDVKPAEENACSGQPKAEENAHRQCRILKSPLFQECQKMIDPAPFYDTCVEQTCSCDTGGECECFCTSVAAYADACGRRGAKVNWRPVTKCPVECEEFTDPSGDLCDIKYDPCRNCIETCCDRCTRGCFEGCFPNCAEGLVYDSKNNTCVERENCPICIKAPVVNVTTGAITTTPSPTTTGRCAYNCSYEDNGEIVYQRIGDTWESGCWRVTCVGDGNGCAYENQNEITCPDTTCEAYEEEIPGSCCSTCECKYCIYDDQTYDKSETWNVGDCITMTCNESCPNATQVNDRRDSCASETPLCREFYSVVIDNTDPCCPEYNCKCNDTLCPEEPTCVGGFRENSKESNECCTVYECLPVCSYQGIEYPNGSRITKTDCYDEICQCTEESCSIYKENERTCSPSPECTNTDTNHYQHIVSEDQCCRTSNCKCECRVYGDPHYNTFDGKYYPFHGICQYTLVTYRDSDDLKIIGDNTECSPDLDNVSCMKKVIIIWKGNTVVLGPGTFITFDDDPILETALPSNFNGITLQKRRSGALRLTIRSIQLTLDYEYIAEVSSVFIEVPMTSWFNTTVGLCGTCTNTREDDFETKEGHKSEESEDFASSWLYNATNENCLPCNPPDHKKCWNCSDPRHGDDIPNYCKANCENICKVLKSDVFSNCNIDVEQYYESCLFDEGKTPKCRHCNSSAIVTYANECDCVKWREALDCIPECPAGQIYKECVPECELDTTCDNLDLGYCTKSNSRGCGCPDGMVRKSQHSEECVEERCCSCSDPSCEHYEELTVAEGEDPTDCCAQKYCKCKAVENPECALPKVLVPTENGTPGCYRNECVCTEYPNCFEVLPKLPDCTSTEGCQGIPIHGVCGCTENVECSCDNTTCGEKTCDPCYDVELTYATQNPDLPCGGNCCPSHNCVPVLCPSPSTTAPPEYPTEECPFIKRVASTYDPSDTDQCCPQTYNLQCLTERCGVIPSPSSCELPGFVSVIKFVNESIRSDIRNFASCPRVDECCTYRECVCKSCPFEGDNLVLGQHPIYVNDGCTQVNCNEGGTLREDGCYEVTKEEPTCPEPPECECYEKLNTLNSLGGAKNTSQWLNLCCPKHSCEKHECSDSYEPGPEQCPYPAERKITYEVTDDGCTNPNCLVATCVCSLCVDSNNNTHGIGTDFVGENHCDTFTCRPVDGELCPRGEKNEIYCNQTQCDEGFEQLEETKDPGECCPKQSCECKSYQDLQHVCENWKNDTSTCPDEENMVLQTREREYVDSRCCPEKSCICKDENERNCEKGANYECPANHDRVQTIDVDETHCCPDYKCVCNCSHVSCPYDSWTVKKEGDVNCECQCECNSSRCDTRIPNCDEYEDMVQTGTTDKGCCPLYDCVCNTTKCPEIPSADCNEYQIEYDWRRYVGACCPDEKKCKCNPSSQALAKLCNETRLNQPQNCSDGWEPYIANVMAGEEDGLCCEVQCRCISCTTDSGEVKMVGSSWEEEGDCKILQHRCSNEKLSNACNKIITEERPITCVYDSLKAFETENCQPNSYALVVSNQTACCPVYECVTCATSSSNCSSITEERIPNTTHPRCPGECVCADMSEDLTIWCYSQATCGQYQEAVSVQGEEEGKPHDDECCPNYKCICSTCPNDTVTMDKVIADSTLCEKVGVRLSDVNKECCKNYELQCDGSCTCPELDDVCNSTVGCFRKIETNNCNCPVKQNCQCHEESCPVIKCGKCEELTTTQLPDNPDAACSGNCCPKEECVSISCNISSEPVIPAHCGFLKKVDVINDDPCCPDKQLKCGQCPSAISEEMCGDQEGYINDTIPVTNSTNEAVRAIADCPMVDECCRPQICLCNSCPYEEGRMEVGQVGFSSDGCTRYSCVKEIKTGDGCYKISKQTPSCPPSPPLECYQTLNTEDALKGATNKDEWPELCCPKYSVDDMPCSPEYEPGPEKCEFPAVKVTTYETNEGCENKNCPIATCTCDKCVDATNQTHDIGTIYPGADDCENVTCLADSDELCPSGHINRIPCNNLQCNSTYENTISENIPGKCCPEERCDCKSEDDMQFICDNWLEDTSHCTDPKHMELIVTGSTSQHKCCPQKTCRCKDPENRNCEKDDDYECGGNYTTVKKANATSDNCCPEFDCICDCSEVACDYITWSAKTSEQECDCRCSCDLEKCPPKPTSCPENMLPVKEGMTDGYCCPLYRCKCDNSSCPTDEVECKDYRYQYERPVYNGSEDCCPVSECICKEKSELESLGCRESCPDGYQKTYNDSISKCCGQCECNTCLTSENTRVKPGVSWNTTEENCQVTKICSDSKLADGCHAIETTFSQKDLCETKEDFLANTCEAVEVVRVLRLYECCPQMRCECTENNTVLSELCEHHNGIECSDFRYPVFMGQFDCCNTYDCRCKVCEYSCPLGYIADKTDRKNETTDNCCDEYSCICDTNYCPTREDYEAENCDARFEVAVNSSQFLQSHPCCTKYECVCKTVQENCPSAADSISCLPSQEPVVHGKLEEPSNCCDDYTCVCKGEDELKDVCPYPEDYACIGDGLVLQEVKSQDPCCHNFTCTCIQSTCSEFCSDCPLGYERREVGGEGCCTNYECQCVSCMVDGVEHPVNTSWTEDSCNILTCRPNATKAEGKNCPIVTSRLKYECAGEGIEDCEKRGGILRGTDETDGCCKECTLCKRVSKLMNLTKVIDGADCLSIAPIDIGSCQGACPTTIPLTGESEAVCACCEPTVILEEILFDCGTLSPFVMEKVSTTGSCKCTGE